MSLAGKFQFQLDLSLPTDFQISFGIFVPSQCLTSNEINNPNDDLSNINTKFNA